MYSRGKYLVQLARRCEDTELNVMGQNINLDISNNLINNPNIEEEDTTLSEALMHDCLFEEDNISCIGLPVVESEQIENRSITPMDKNTYNNGVNYYLSNSNINKLGTGDNKELDPTCSPSNESCTSDKEVEGSENEQENQNKGGNQHKNNQLNISPEQKNTRKRKTNEHEWKRNERKFKRNKGLAYISSRNKLVKERTMLEPCKERCIFKCSDKISNMERLTIFKNYWDLGNVESQRSYILKCTSKIPHTVTSQNQRKPNQAFYFETNSKKIRVCKTFFVNTLGISDRVVRTVIDKTVDGFLAKDKRGMHQNHPKVDVSINEGIISHIKAIPRIESHYLRSQTTREFIEGGKTLADIYRDYVQKCKDAGTDFGNYTRFSRIFNTNFNISFFTPKKDQCGICEEFENSTELQKESLSAQYNTHINEKTLSRIEKENDKQKAKANECVSACFDLQAVLQTPCGDINSFYYKSKLSTYNFTIFYLGTKEGHCYVWHEGDANRGSSEIGTCILKFLQVCPKNRDVILYADNCCGQNKNKFIASLLLYAVRYLDIPSISLKFLVVGHTQNEGDNMHSLIEKQKKRALKSGPVYTPAQWIPIISLAKKTGTPYKITDMDYTDFYDLKFLQEQIGNNFTVNDLGERIVWHDIAILKFLKEDPNAIYYKSSYSEDKFKKCIVRKNVRTAGPNNIKLKLMYDSPLKISETKINALTELCEKKHIKIKYHDFYRSLGCNIRTEDNEVVFSKKQSKSLTKKNIR